MNFLAPWFLIGAIAIGGPILFHLIRRVSKERIPFSSLMFLRPLPPRLTQRRQIEHLWLLLLRCLCLILLAIGFARPFLAKDVTLPTPPAESRQTLILIDTSASMKRENLWNKARAVAESYLKKASPGDQVAVVTFDRQPRTLLTFAEWTAALPDQRVSLAQQRLALAAPSWFGTHLGLALTSAAETFGDNRALDKSDRRREIVLISDLQEGARLEGLQGHEWPSGVKVIVERVNAIPQANAGLEILNESTAASDSERPTRVRVTNARDSNREKFHITWATGATPVGEPLEVYLAPGQTRTLPAPKTQTDVHPDRLLLTGDEVAFDNQSWYASAQNEQVKIAWLGQQSPNDPQQLRYYVERVFQNTPRRSTAIVSSDLLSQSAFAIIPGAISSAEAAAVRNWLTQGKSALLVLTNAQMGPTISALVGQSGSLTEAEGEYALLGQIDFSHPLFALFADPRFSDFSHIHFWKHRRFELPAVANARALAKFDDGSPALAQIPVGKGTLVVLASGWNPVDSQLAVSSKFPPLMQTMLEWSGSASVTRLQFSTGDAIPAPPGTGEVRWQKPDGKTVALAANVAFTETDQPGLYVASVSGKEYRYAVNLPLDESRTAPISPDELARLGVPMQTPTAGPVALSPEHLRHLRESEIENHQKLWRWLIVAALVVTLGEVTLSGWLSRRVKTGEATP